MKNSFEICVRGIILQQGKILICQMKRGGHYFFPGGHVNLGEKAENALRRELREELGIGLKKLSFIGTVENIYKDKKLRHHEVNLVFSVSVEKPHQNSLEDHISFKFMTLKEFSNKKVLPVVLQKMVLRWFKDKKIFWASKNGE